MLILFYVLLVIVSTGIVWKGSELLEDSSEKLSAFYKLPPIVQGAVVVAVGSSFPELATTVIATLVHGSFELGVAAIVGSAIFNILVIPGLSGLAGKEQLQSNRDLVYKEAQFYMIAISVLLLTFSFAAIYNPVERSGSGGAILGEMDRTIALIPLLMYGLYIFLQWQDTMDYEAEEREEKISAPKQWFRLGSSLLIILVGVEGLVRSAIAFGDIFGTPAFLWGITVVAAGTSVPDAFVSIRAAQKGNAVTSLANVLGSNIFDLLVCIPVGVLIAGVAVINYSVAAPMMAALTFATLILFAMMRTGMHLSRNEAKVLLLLYVLFVAWITLESFQVIDLVPHLPPPEGVKG